jgi:hypothetical protein
MSLAAIAGDSNRQICRWLCAARRRELEIDIKGSRVGKETIQPNLLESTECIQSIFDRKSINSALIIKLEFDIGASPVAARQGSCLVDADKVVTLFEPRSNEPSDATCHRS